MQQIFLDEIRTHISRNKYKQIFRKFVQFLCCVVVFCTTYALILPAITMEQTAYCGLEEHTHSEECYQELPHQELVCNEDTLQLHNHSESCYDSDANLICGLADYVVHTHAETCFYNGQLVCTLPERGVHVHNDACYIPGETEPEVLHVHTDSCSTQQQGELLCTIEEYEGHAHDAACYAAGDTLECTLAENHVHQESCYTYPLICTLSTDPHIHSADCYGIGEQLCTTEEGHVHGSDCSITSLNCENTEKGHEHNDSCYHTEVICTIPENHFHDSSCYSSVILCGKTEGEFHEHGADCYSMEPQLNCSLAENHFHDDSCYLQELVCTIPEDPGHSHGEDCYQWETVLVCGLEEGQPEPTEPAEPILNCTEPVAQEHIHSENCFVTVGTEPTPKCGITEEDHIHTEDCYVCTIEEHTHTLACYSDPEADVESPAVWEATFAHVALTGDWPTDVVAIAETQIGYTESTRNYEVWEDNSVHGYTRYGAWYGVPYGDWCGMFASFCLDYAGVEGMPYHYGVRPWIEDLASRGLYYSARETKAQKGNLIFFDWEGDGLSDHVGIVAEVQEAQEHAGASIKAIEGNASNCVKYVYYSPDDPVILGYGLLPGQERIPLSVEEPEDTTPDRALEILICGTPAHSHSESCYDSDGALICKKDEHIHTIDCADPSSPVGYAYAGDMMRML
ncbi:MAG: CHAP domain-containing protein, partial [Clostridia bacterium]|nr:CHAP domain-containing protein [Clostridia bacterium]